MGMKGHQRKGEKGEKNSACNNRRAFWGNAGQIHARAYAVRTRCLRNWGTCTTMDDGTRGKRGMVGRGTETNTSTDTQGRAYRWNTRSTPQRWHEGNAAHQRGPYAERVTKGECYGKQKESWEMCTDSSDASALNILIEKPGRKHKFFS